RRRAVKLGRPPERGDLGHDRGEMIDGRRDLAGQIGAVTVAVAVQPLLEVPRVEPQPGQWILELVSHLRGHAAEGGQRAAPQPVQLVSIPDGDGRLDRKSTRLNSSHVSISYAVFCL